MYAKSLEQLDQMVRVAVRKWYVCGCHMIHDYFHAKASDGELKVPCLRYKIPLLKAQRVAKVEESIDPVIQSFWGKEEVCKNGKGGWSGAEKQQGGKHPIGDPASLIG